MTPSSFVQRNLYKGTEPRFWVRLRFMAVDGSLHERELLADTGSPCAVILGQADLALLDWLPAAGIHTNFGPLTGGNLTLNMPELGLVGSIHSYGSDDVLHAVARDCPDFAGLAGLPLLRMVEYGGDSTSFWIRKPGSGP